MCKWSWACRMAGHLNARRRVRRIYPQLVEEEGQSLRGPCLVLSEGRFCGGLGLRAGRRRAGCEPPYRAQHNGARDYQEERGRDRKRVDRRGVEGHDAHKARCDDCHGEHRGVQGSGTRGETAVETAQGAGAGRALTDGAERKGDAGLVR
jgi:hypothetical protein